MTDAHNTEIVVLMTDQGSSTSNEDLVSMWKKRLEIANIRHYKIVSANIIKHAED